MSIMESSISRGKIYNLGNSNQQKTLTELAQNVIDELAPESDLTVDILGTFEGSDRKMEREIFTRFCDTSLAQTELGYNPQISVVEGIRRLAESKHLFDDWPSQFYE